jgi:hypothetical protein
MSQKPASREQGKAHTAERNVRTGAKDRFVIKSSVNACYDFRQRARIEDAGRELTIAAVNVDNSKKQTPKRIAGCEIQTTSRLI